MDDVDAVRTQQTTEVKTWKLFSKKLPRNKIIYFTQIVLIYIVATTSLVNLSIGNENQALWSSLLSACIGYALPAPQLLDDEPLLPDTSKQQLDDVL